jgi:hypothetical protein
VVRIVSGSGKLRLRSQSSLYIFQETQGQHVLKPSNICAYANRCAHGYLIEIAGQCDVGTLEEARATNDAMAQAGRLVRDSTCTTHTHEHSVPQSQESHTQFGFSQQ